MTGAFLLAWVVFPALALLLCTGTGLLVRRAAGDAAVPAVLIVPVGLASLFVLGGMLCYYESVAPFAGPAFAVVGALGLILERRTLRQLLSRWRTPQVLWPAAAGFGAWMVLAAPVLLSGEPSFSGYAHIVDISYEFDLAVHFAHGGQSIPAEQLSAYQTVLRKYVGAGYPGGGPWTLGALSNLMPVDLTWLYQPFLALISGCTALSLYALLGRVISSRGWRALAAFVAAQPNVLMAYALAGGIKELGTASFLVLTAALFAGREMRLRPGRSAIAVPIAIAATVAAFSLPTLPWVAVLTIGTCLTLAAFERTWPERALALGGAAQMAALSVVFSLPTLAAALKLLPSVTGKGPVDLGNLAGPIPAISAAGVWITGDIRFPLYAHHGPSEAIAILVLVLAAIGVVWAIVRRLWSLAWLGAAGGIALYYIAQRYGPWIQFKADCITAPIALALAFAGVGALLRSGLRGALGALAALVVTGGVLAGNALLYHDTTIAPYARLHNLQYIGERFAGQGPTLTPDFEEYSEYYLRDDEQTSMVNGPTLELRPEVNRATEPGGIYQYDLNEYVPAWVETFRTIVMRRNPLSSRPPANYRLVYLSNWYEVWQRSGPASTPYLQVPLVDRLGNLRPVCGQVMSAARKAGPGAHIALMPSPPGWIQDDGSNMALSGALSNAGGGIAATGAGRAVREQPFPASGRYEFFLGGSIGRPVQVSVDGRPVGTAAYQVSYPGEYVRIGTSWISEGVHTIAISRGGISLHAGNGDGVDALNRLFGPLRIVPVADAVPSVREMTPAAFAHLCRTAYPARWVEVLQAA
jgi:hypothetical protein